MKAKINANLPSNSFLPSHEIIGRTSISRAVRKNISNSSNDRCILVKLTNLPNLHLDRQLRR